MTKHFSSIEVKIVKFLFFSADRSTLYVTHRSAVGVRRSIGRGGGGVTLLWGCTK